MFILFFVKVILLKDTFDVLKKILDTDRYIGDFRTLSREMKSELQDLGVPSKEIKKFQLAYEQADNVVFEYTQQIKKIAQLFSAESEKYED
jgi:hypothetical protein